MPLTIIQRQLGHTNLGTTSIYLQGIDPEEIITAVRGRRAPMMAASAGIALWRNPMGERERLCAPASPGRKQASTHAPQTLCWIVHCDSASRLGGDASVHAGAKAKGPHHRLALL
jgi:hypothetical protein